VRFHHMARRILLAPALGLALAAAVAACSSGPSTTSTPPATSPTATAPSSPSASATTGGGSSSAVTAITANWEKFFSSSTPNSERVALLQNGSVFAPTVAKFSSSPLAAAVSAKVDSVTLTSATQANVTYDLTAAGTSVAKGATGVAVLENGVWKVGDASFCGLLRQGSSFLNIPLPAACK
jgi:hypothetical protein